MLYLLYLRNGFIKKFPLDKETILLGRSKSSDLFIDEPFVSKKHAMLTIQEDTVIIRDQESTNGVFTEKGQVKEARIRLNEWFRVGYIKFFLKEGNAREFILSDKVQPLFQRLSRSMASPEETNEAVNILYADKLVEMLQIGFSLQKYGNLFQAADTLIRSALKKGCLLVAAQEDGQRRVESQWGYAPQYEEPLRRILSQKEVFKAPHKNVQLEENLFFCAFPLPVRDQAIVLIYMNDVRCGASTLEFLDNLAMEVSVIHSLMEHNTPQGAGPATEKAPEIITVNQKMLNLLSRCKKIAQSNLAVLIEGETGTGKELFARFIHFHSKRSKGAFIGLNCAAIPENLMEVELFGNEKGAFTDAGSQRKGKLEMVSGGTLVLDEIGDMPLNLQAKLLRTIQEGQFYRVGGNQPINVDLRLICMTNKDVKSLMQRKLFREDLYYRIAHVTLTIPPLRERKEDIIPLINFFIENASRESGIYIKGFSDRALKAMESYDWPGNVREFENEMMKILNLSEAGDIIDLDALKEEIVFQFENTNPAQPSQDIEKSRLLNLLEQYKWNKSQVAKELNVSRMTLYEKLKKYGI